MSIFDNTLEFFAFCKSNDGWMGSQHGSRFQYQRHRAACLLVQTGRLFPPSFGMEPLSLGANTLPQSRHHPRICSPSTKPQRSNRRNTELQVMFFQPHTPRTPENTCPSNTRGIPEFERVLYVEGWHREAYRLTARDVQGAIAGGKPLLPGGIGSTDFEDTPQVKFQQGDLGDIRVPS